MAETKTSSGSNLGVKTTMRVPGQPAMRKTMQAIPVLTLESRIKRALRAHLLKVGFGRSGSGNLVLPDTSKEVIRRLHGDQRNDRIRTQEAFIERSWRKLHGFFAEGREVVPDLIAPELELIQKGTWQSDLFRLASLSWSVPVSLGYGRRLRFLVWDRNNNKLMGLIALGDPVFNLRVRDQYIGWSVDQRTKNLVGILDAYVLGAIPPYNMLLCGKVLACLIRTTDVRDRFSAKYTESAGVISKERKRAKLVAVTTTSALGRSSIYNRLQLNGQNYFLPIGYTTGWGHFHIPSSLFDLMREYLRLNGHEYADNTRFGDGPNWRFRAIRQVLDMLDLNPNMLKHGVPREVFYCELASNSRDYLSGKSKNPLYRGLKTVSEVAESALARWVIPRAFRRPEYSNWQKSSFLKLIGCGDQNVASHMTPASEVGCYGSCERQS